MKTFREIVINSNLITVLRIVGELFSDFRQLSRNLGAISTKSSQKKWEYKLIIEAHSLEKGMSMNGVRIGFGEKKVYHILKEIKEYQSKYIHLEFVDKIHAILEAYFKFNKENGHINLDLEEEYMRIFKTSKIKSDGGTYTVHKTSVENAININFDAFLKSRFAIRDFDTSPVDLKLIYKAIEMARKTPSACNRQPWRVYVYTGDKKNRILNWQGNKGFIEDIQVAIVISSSIECFFINEIHQAFIDGGLYAMTLLLCLHSVGLGSIPLTLGMMSSKNKSLYKEFGLSKDEVPILMIGVGNMKEAYKVAVSERNDKYEYLKTIS